MISSTVVHVNPVSYDFPVFLQSKTLPDLIVLFTNEETGTVVAVPDDADPSDLSVGLHADGWNIAKFDYFGGDILLSNESFDDSDTDTPCDDCASPCVDGSGDVVGTRPELLDLSDFLARVIQQHAGVPAKSTAQPTPDTPPAATSQDGDCGYDNAFRAFLERLAKSQSARSHD